MFVSSQTNKATIEEQVKRNKLPGKEKKYTTAPEKSASRPNTRANSSSPSKTRGKGSNASASSNVNNDNDSGNRPTSSGRPKTPRTPRSVTIKSF